MFKFRIGCLTAVAIFLGSSFAAANAYAQGDYPAKPIRIVMPVPPGSGLDVITRVIAEQMSGSLGQQVVVEPRPGAGGLLAAQAVASSPADGYTLLGGASGTLTILPAQKDKLPIEMDRAFTHAGMIVGRAAMFLAVSPKLGVKSFPEFIALAKSRPEQIVIGTNGAGTLPHYAGLLLQRKGGLPVTIAPYNSGGTSAAIADIMGGRVHAAIEGLSGIRGQLQSGDLRLIAVMAPERDPDFPDVPTVAESLPGLTAVGFMSLAAPADTPAPILQRLNDSLNRALATDTVKKRFSEFGIPISPVSVSQANTFVNQQRAIWLPLVKELESQ